MTKDEALRMALEALEYEPIGKTSGEKDLKDQAITAIKEALAQTEQEPVACVGPWHDGRLTLIPRYSHQTFEREQPLYTTPPQPKEPEQEPVAMKFKIYKPTVPDPTRQDINNALLPWVYDQDRSSGFDASMWVTPVATLPPQRTWVGLTDEELPPLVGDNGKYMELKQVRRFYKYVEAKLKEKNT